jgi:UDP-glucuronate 4-epimerase
MKKILITGMAGFIGFHLAKLLQKSDYQIVGIDNLNDYYDPNLKLARLKELGLNTESIDYNKVIDSDNITFIKLDLTDLPNLTLLFEKHQFDYVVNLAAQAGVRYSIKNPQSYVDSNITGFLNILECCRACPVTHLVFASSSSVYGMSKQIPYHEDHVADHPLSMYAATKKANEMMAHTYANLFEVPCTGLRFFTVYGPYGRPDMAPMIFTKAIQEERTIEVFNNGEMHRDFTYVDDIVESMQLLIPKPPAKNNLNFDEKKPKTSVSKAPYQLFNIGNSQPVALMNFIHEIERNLGKKAKIEFKPMQQGDVKATYANIEKLESYLNFKPKTSIEKGVKQLIGHLLKA